MPPEPLKLVDPERDTAVVMFCKYSDGFLPSPFQQDMIEQLVTDLPRWEKTLIFWFGNGYRAQSIQKMIDYYEGLKNNNGTNRQNNGNKQSGGSIIANRHYRNGDSG